MSITVQCDQIGPYICKSCWCAIPHTITVTGLLYKARSSLKQKRVDRRLRTNYIMCQKSKSMLTTLGLLEPEPLCYASCHAASAKSRSLRQNVQSGELISARSTFLLSKPLSEMKVNSDPSA